MPEDRKDGAKGVKPDPVVLRLNTIGSTIVLLMFLGFLLFIRACNCPKCDGSGYTTMTEYRLGLFPSEKAVTCDMCQGERTMTPGVYLTRKMQGASRK